MPVRRVKSPSLSLQILLLIMISCKFISLLFVGEGSYSLSIWFKAHERCTRTRVEMHVPNFVIAFFGRCWPTHSIERHILAKTNTEEKECQPFAEYTYIAGPTESRNPFQLKFIITFCLYAILGKNFGTIAVSTECFMHALYVSR